MRLRFFGAALLSAATLLSSPAARADEPAPREGADGTTLTPVPKSKVKKRFFAIFDPYQTRYGLDFTGGPMWSRPARGFNGDSEIGAEISLGQSQYDLRSFWYIGGRFEVALEALDSKSFALVLPRYSYVAGVRLGPIEPELGVSFSLLNLDVIHKEFSFGLLSPGARGGIALDLGAVRLSAVATTEYRWRWLGDQDYRLRSLLLTLSLQQFPFGS